jgi:CheY-like chemotaxis protein
LDALQRGEPFDIILCDVMMPTMTGMEFYERVRVHDEALTKRIIFFSGGVIGTPLESFVHALGSSYVAKPFRPEELVNRIQEKLTTLGQRPGAAAAS